MDSILALIIVFWIVSAFSKALNPKKRAKQAEKKRTAKHTGGRADKPSAAPAEQQMARQTTFMMPPLEPRPIGWQARAFLLYRKEKGAPKETPPRCAALLLGTDTASRAARSAGNTRNKHFFGDAACSVQISSHKRRPGLSKERLLAALYGSISSAVCAFTRLGPQ